MMARMESCVRVCVCVCSCLKGHFEAMGSARADALIYLCVSQHISGTRGPDTTDGLKMNTSNQSSDDNHVF